MLRSAVPLIRSLVLIIIAFAIAGLTFQLTGYSAVATLRGALQGSVTAPGALTSSLRWAIPLALTGVGVLVCFRAGFFNVGAQGQVYAGAICAYAITATWPRGPAFVVIGLALLAGVVGGGLWAIVPGILRVRFRTDEVLSTLMMSFIGILVLDWVTTGPYKDPAGSGEAASTPPLRGAVRISGVSGVSVATLAITLGVILAIWFLVRRTTFGLKSSLAGRNPLMARWQGINLRSLGIGAFAVGGATAGLAGALELLGPAGRLTSGFSPGLGFAAVLVALVGVLTVPGVIIAALFFGGLSSAVLYLPIVTTLPTSALSLLQGIVAILITIRIAPESLRRPIRRSTLDQPNPGVPSQLTEV